MHAHGGKLSGNQHGMCRRGLLGPKCNAGVRACVPCLCREREKPFAMCCVQRGARRAIGLVLQRPAAGGSRSGEDSKAPGVTGSGEEDEEAKVTLANGMHKDQEMSRLE